MPEQVPITEILEAELRLWRTEEEKLEWVLSFAQMDLDRLTRGDWINVCAGLGAFLSTNLATPRTREFVEFVLKSIKETPGSTFDVHQPTPNEARELQQIFRQIISKFLNDEHQFIEPKGIKIALYKGNDLSVLCDWAQINIRPKEYYSYGQYMLALLLGDLGHKIKICPEKECSRWFVSRRKNQEYCSRKCQTRRASREFQRQKKRKSA